MTKGQEFERFLVSYIYALIERSGLAHDKVVARAWRDKTPEAAAKAWRRMRDTESSTRLSISAAYDLLAELGREFPHAIWDAHNEFMRLREPEEGQGLALSSLIQEDPAPYGEPLKKKSGRPIKKTKKGQG